MPRHPRPDSGSQRAPATGDDLPASGDDPTATPARARAADDGAGSIPSLAGLGIAGISRRRIAWAGVVVAAAWIVVAFAGQAASASQSTTDLAAARARYDAAAAQTDALRTELALVTQQRWVLQQARAYQLGSRAERPFALAPGAPSLPPDAPGSAARRLGAQPTELTPLEAWLEVLFGPAPGH